MNIQEIRKVAEIHQLCCDTARVTLAIRVDCDSNIAGRLLEGLVARAIVQPDSEGFAHGDVTMGHRLWLSGTMEWFIPLGDIEQIVAD